MWCIPIDSVTSETAEKFWSFVSTGDGCWEWTGTRGKAGYGVLYIDGRQFRAHRVSYFLAHGTIDNTLVIDHLCKNKRCVNPGHLELVTEAVNALRSDAPPAVNARKVACDNGHPLTDGNVYVWPSTGYKTCLTCRDVKYSAANRAKYAANKEAIKARERDRYYRRRYGLSEKEYKENGCKNLEEPDQRAGHLVV